MTMLNEISGGNGLDAFDGGWVSLRVMSSMYSGFRERRCHRRPERTPPPAVVDGEELT
jgi:hypothetical protein